MSATEGVPPAGLARRVIPRPEEPVPALAVPTMLVMVGALALWAGSTVLALSEVWPWGVSVPVNAVADFALFTVAHEASHRTISSHHWVDAVCGRLAQVLYLPHASFGLFRYCHMQHHRFTNHHDGSDPDAGVSHGGGPMMLAQTRATALLETILHQGVKAGVFRPSLGETPIALEAHITLISRLLYCAHELLHHHALTQAETSTLITDMVFAGVASHSHEEHPANSE